MRPESRCRVRRDTVKSYVRSAPARWGVHRRRTRMYYDKDADLSLIQAKTVAIIGFGSQGHAHAQNLRDSGVTVVVSDVPGTPNAARAEKAGFEVLSAGEATKRADVVMMLLPEELHTSVYKNDIAPNLKDGATLMFAHGFNVHYNQVVPPATVDVSMVAPKSPRTSCGGCSSRVRACPCSSPSTRT